MFFAMRVLLVGNKIGVVPTERPRAILKNKRVVKATLIVLVAFLFCHSPRIYFIAVKAKLSDEAYFFTDVITKLPVVANSFLNTLVYYGRLARIRKETKRMLRLCLC